MFYILVCRQEEESSASSYSAILIPNYVIFFLSSFSASSFTSLSYFCILYFHDLYLVFKLLSLISFESMLITCINPVSIDKWSWDAVSSFAFALLYLFQQQIISWVFSVYHTCFSGASYLLTWEWSEMEPLSSSSPVYHKKLRLAKFCSVKHLSLFFFLFKICETLHSPLYLSLSELIFKFLGLFSSISLLYIWLSPSVEARL